MGQYNWHIHKDDISKPFHWDQFPDRIHIGNDEYKEGKFTFTDEEIKNAGYITIDAPPHENGNDNYWYYDKSLGSYRWYDNTEGLKRERFEDQRNEDFFRTDWRYLRYERQKRAGIPTTDYIEELDAFCFALGDIPEQEGYPDNIIWPEDPVEHFSFRQEDGSSYLLLEDNNFLRLD